MHGISIIKPSLLTAVPSFMGQLFWGGILINWLYLHESFLQTKDNILVRGSIDYVTQTPPGSPTWLSQVSPARVRDQPGQGPAAWTGPAPSYGSSSPPSQAPSAEKNRPHSPAQRPFPSPWRWSAPSYEPARAHQALKENDKDRKILTIRHAGHSRIKPITCDIEWDSISSGLFSSPCHTKGFMEVTHEIQWGLPWLTTWR